MSDFKDKVKLWFNEYENQLNGHKGSAIHDIRRNAIAHFLEEGIPTLKKEEWKYTNLNFINNNNFELMIQQLDDGINPEDINDFLLKDIKEHLLVFVNGFYSPKLSRIGAKKKEIILGSLAEAIKKNKDEVDENFGKYLPFDNDSFTALNTAFAQDGAFIVIPDGSAIETPIHILYLTDARNGAVLSCPRNLIIAGECSQFKIIETYHTIGDFPAFTNLVTELSLGFSSNVEYYKIQNDNGHQSYYIGTTQVNQQRASHFSGNTISLSGKFIRNNLNTVMNAEACEANLNGFYYINGQNFVDNHTLVDHAKPNSSSREFYKGILDEKSGAVFNGKIIVREDAQKTTSYQSNKNIMLTDDAKINTKPQLEIFADDVKCSHGATSGYLDKDSLFYLKTRGISDEMAKSLLLNAFAGEIIEKFNITELRDEVKRQVAKRLIVDDIYFCDVLEQTKY